jgi:hypothetical protein
MLYSFDKFQKDYIILQIQIKYKNIPSNLMNCLSSPINPILFFLSLEQTSSATLFYFSTSFIPMEMKAPASPSFCRPIAIASGALTRRFNDKKSICRQRDEAGVHACKRK